MKKGIKAILIIIIVLLLIINCVYSEKAYNQCLNNGNSESLCSDLL